MVLFSAFTRFMKTPYQHSGANLHNRGLFLFWCKEDDILVRAVYSPLCPGFFDSTGGHNGPIF